jgi:hypothetical protein
VRLAGFLGLAYGIVLIYFSFAAYR